MFKNATLFNLPADDSVIGQLMNESTDVMASAELKPVGSCELRSSGFVPPGLDARLMLRIDKDHAPAANGRGTEAALIQLGTEERAIPAATLKAAIRERIEAYREKMGRTPGKRTRDQLKDEVLQELLPRAFVKPGRCYAYLDLAAGLLVVDSASERIGEVICGKLREALGSFAAEPVVAENPVGGVLTRWLLDQSNEAAAEGFSLGDDVEMKDPLDTRAAIKVRKHDLGLDEIREHARQGKRVTAMGLVFDNRVSFTLDESLKLRKIKFTDVVTETLDLEGADAQMELEARFALMALEMRRVFLALRRVFGMI